MKFHYLIALLFVSVLAGCATDYSKKRPEEIASLVKTYDSEFNASRITLAPEVKASAGLFVDYTAQLGKAVTKKDGGTSHILVVTWRYTSNASWLYFETATLAGPRPLQTVLNDRQVSTCSGGACNFTEQISAIVPVDVLESARANRQNLIVRFGARRGAYDVSLPANYVAGYMQGIAQK